MYRIFNPQGAPKALAPEISNEEWKALDDIDKIFYSYVPDGSIPPLPIATGREPAEEAVSSGADETGAPAGTAPDGLITPDTPVAEGPVDGLETPTTEHKGQGIAEGWGKPTKTLDEFLEEMDPKPYPEDTTLHGEYEGDVSQPPAGDINGSQVADFTGPDENTDGRV